MASDHWFLLRGDGGTYLDRRDVWQSYAEYGVPFRTLEDARHDARRLRDYKPAVFAELAGVTRTNDGRVDERWYSLTELCL